MGEFERVDIGVLRVVATEQRATCKSSRYKDTQERILSFLVSRKSSGL
jgi:hypothetical protein